MKAKGKINKEILKIEIYITQTFNIDASEEVIEKAGDAAYKAVIEALRKKGMMDK